MNCQDFSSRMQQCLDDRLGLESDRHLQRHARQCERCRGQLEAWQQVAAVMPPLGTAKHKHHWPLAVSGLAAALACLPAAVAVATTRRIDSQPAKSSQR